MLGKYGETLVVDWGLAKATGKVSELGQSTDTNPITKEDQQPAMARAERQTAGTCWYVKSRAAARAAFNTRQLGHANGHSSWHPSVHEPRAGSRPAR